jgi:branched-chain amino acid transport system permease protein
VTTVALLRRAAIVGVVAGLAVWHVSLVGMVQAFQTRPIITGEISLGELLPVLALPIAGFWASGVRSATLGRPPAPLALLAGATAGAAVGAMIAILCFFITTLHPNGMLINGTPVLVKDLRIGMDPLMGTIVQVVGGAVIAGATAGLRLLPRTASRIVVFSVITVLLFGVMKNLVSQLLSNMGLKVVSTFLYRGDGLSVPGAIVLLVVAGVAMWLWATRSQGLADSYRAMPAGNRQTAKIAAFGVMAVIVILLPTVLGPFLADVVTTVGIFILLGLGLNIVVGFAGLLDLGYVAFYALGMYSIAVLTSPASPAFHPQLNFWLALPIVMGIGAAVGLIIGAPVLRLRGDYLAIVTLGFGEIARIIFLSEWMTPYVGGANGIQGIPAPTIFGIVFRDQPGSAPGGVYYPLLAAIVIAALVAWSLYNSRVGRAWAAMREDETVAEATGVNTIAYKLLAFAMGAVFGAVAGAFYAAKIGVVFPQNLDILISINALALIILGGMGNIWGVLVGALVLVGLPGLLREFAQYQLLIFGAVLVAMMLFRPEGLIPNRSRRAELHESGEEEDASGTDGDQAPPPTLGGSLADRLVTESGATHTRLGDGP